MMEEQNEGDTENIFIMLHTIIFKLSMCFQYSVTKSKVIVINFKLWMRHNSTAFFAE